MAVNPNSHIIAVSGGKGGVGKSIFAANLAAAFLLEMRKPVLLIDLDQQSCGDQNMILGLREVRTVGDLCSFSSSISQSTLTQVTTVHPQTNLAFIAAVRSRDETLNVQADTCVKQIEALSNFFPYIIVDIGSNLGPLQMSVLNKATAVLLVTLPEVLAVNQTLRMVNELLAATLPGDMMQIVVNKVSPNALAPAMIGQTLKRSVVGAIPVDDVTATGSLQRSTLFVPAAPKIPISAAYFETVRKLTGGVLTHLKALARPKELQFKKEAPVANDSGSRMRAPSRSLDPRTKLKLTVHDELIRAMDLKKGITDTQGDVEKEKELWRKTQAVVTSLVDKESPGLGRDERGQIIKEVLEEALGLGPLEDLLKDEAVTEIMVNGHQKIYVEKGNGISLSPITFTSNFHLRKVIERIVSPLGRQINESSPYVDARLKDGSRVNAVIEPLSIDGPAVTIRKFRKKPVSPETYTKEWNAATVSMIEFLRICVLHKLNVVISGGTGSGKTTLLNTLSGFIPSNERIITIEDAAELALKQEHVVRLETRPSNMEGEGQVSIRDLVKNSLRMRPDRIVVGECRDGAALDMLQAMNTGHDGSMTTVHANSPKEAVTRLETLCLMSGMDLPGKAIREQIANAVHIIVQISRLPDHSRKIMSITEVQGMQGEVVTLQTVFEFRERGFDKNRKIIGNFFSTGLVPKFIQDLERSGIIIPRTLFSNDAPMADGKSLPAAPTEVKKASGGGR